MRSSSSLSQSRQSSAQNLPVTPHLTWRESHRPYNLPTGMIEEAGTHWRWGKTGYSDLLSEHPIFPLPQRSPCFAFPQEKYSSDPNPGQAGSCGRWEREIKVKITWQSILWKFANMSSLVISVHANFYFHAAKWFILIISCISFLAILLQKYLLQ